MPYIGDGEGTFTPEGYDEPCHYRVEAWVKEGEYPERREVIDTPDLIAVDFMVVEVWKDDPQNPCFDTIWGPLDDWQFIEDYLAYDFGVDGSRNGEIV